MSSATTLYCRQCKKKVTFHVEPIRHWKQLLISILSCGLWLPVWISMVMAPTRICDACGQPLWEDPTSSPS